MNLQDAHQEEPTEHVRSNRRAILIDIGGVLVPDYLNAAAATWGGRLGIAPHAFITVLFAGNDDHILIGRTSEADWWRIVADRLRVGEDLLAEIRGDLAARRTWNTALLTGLRRLHSQATIAIVSNAWPDIRAGMTDAGVLDLAHTVVLSCEVGHAKPDPRIYAIALERTGTDPADALFIDDTPGHVDAACALGMTGHVHTDTGETLVRIETFVHSRG
jgi:putative hydrolase of the HAD superfamily